MCLTFFLQKLNSPVHFETVPLGRILIFSLPCSHQLWIYNEGFLTLVPPAHIQGMDKHEGEDRTYIPANDTKNRIEQAGAELCQAHVQLC